MVAFLNSSDVVWTENIWCVQFRLKKPFPNFSVIVWTWPYPVDGLNFPSKILFLTSVKLHRKTTWILSSLVFQLLCYKTNSKLIMIKALVLESVTRRATPIHETLTYKDLNQIRHFMTFYKATTTDKDIWRHDWSSHLYAQLKSSWEIKKKKKNFYGYITYWQSQFSQP